MKSQLEIIIFKKTASKKPSTLTYLIKSPKILKVQLAINRVCIFLWPIFKTKGTGKMVPLNLSSYLRTTFEFLIPHLVKKKHISILK
jgi:hypothetical protein